ncbi:hypothetical protein FHU33_2031 [Blastococcus colisei]|uniref:Uncharacterized protein n=1 Tax=Blastococcus colisei TaxID=1564162 RepID=A0A543PEW4_9ACTN|nr:hypothetical protein [Blastococcus colisei]TQN42625.1 hypothetical protein FHU33_2031 [Blastococcus colisei]
MPSGTGRPQGDRAARARRTGGAVVLAALGAVGLAACGDSPEGEVSTVTLEDLRELEDDVAALEERVAVLEGAQLGPATTTSPAAPSSEAGDGPDTTFLSDPSGSLGEEVTVTATIRSATVSDIGSVFRLADGTGRSVPVVSATPTGALADGDVVEVSGTVLRIEESTFEQDFGIAPDELVEEPDRWLRENEGDVAISADRVAIVQEEQGS